MILQIILPAAEKVFNITFRWLDQNLTFNFIQFVKGIEFGIVITVAIFFLLATAYMVLRQYKKLPKSYRIVVYDVFGRETVIDGLRQIFTTYDAAESYANLYSEMYGREQYKFEVIGSFL